MTSPLSARPAAGTPGRPMRAYGIKGKTRHKCKWIWKRDMTEKKDDLRPKGTVEVTCQCGWSFWIDPLDPLLPDGPFECPSCESARTGIYPTKKAE